MALAGVLVSGMATAGSGSDINVECNVHSDYEFALTAKSVVLTRKTGSPETVLIRDGRLFINDAWVTVSAADSQRLKQYERDTRAAMPLAMQISKDAADIAFTALGEVAKSMSKDPARTNAKLKEARAELDRALARSITANSFNSDALGKGIGKAVGDVMPMIVGDIVGGALRAAFSGNDQNFDQFDDMDARIDAIVEPRARALEKNAQQLCTQMRALDGIDNALEYRYHGQPLDLLRVEDRVDGDTTTASTAAMD